MFLRAAAVAVSLLAGTGVNVTFVTAGDMPQALQTYAAFMHQFAVQLGVDKVGLDGGRKPSP